MSYTPGPWRINESRERVWIEGTGRGCGVPRVAIVDDSAGTEPGNANLLAAAPELLEALEEIIASNPSILATERSALRYVQAVEKARKVIGKARGEATP